MSDTLKGAKENIGRLWNKFESSVVYHPVLTAISTVFTALNVGNILAYYKVGGLDGHQWGWRYKVPAVGFMAYTGISAFGADAWGAEHANATHSKEALFRIGKVAADVGVGAVGALIGKTPESRLFNATFGMAANSSLLELVYQGCASVDCICKPHVPPKQLAPLRVK